MAHFKDRCFVKGLSRDLQSDGKPGRGKMTGDKGQVTSQKPRENTCLWSAGGGRNKANLARNCFRLDVATRSSYDANVLECARIVEEQRWYGPW